MPSRVAAYGFLGRFSGTGGENVKRDAYRTPFVAGGPWGFKLYGLVLWPDPLDMDGLLLSLKVNAEDGAWKELLPSPAALARYVPPRVDFDTALGCVPQRIRDLPGQFHTFSGETPHGWTNLQNSPEVTIELQDTPPGRVAARWTGSLRGLLFLGTVS